MSGYRHIRTGGCYTVISSSFCVLTQTHQWVYINTRGQIFNRSKEDFAKKFKLVEANVQETIIPKG